MLISFKVKHMNYIYNNFYLKSRNDYYGEVLFPKDPNKYQNFICNKENSIITSKTIVFRNITFGDDEKSVISSFGKPRFVLQNPYPLLPVKVIFYKEKIENFSVITQMHFFENKFFYACYTFRRWTNKDLSFFKEIIFNKYIEKDDIFGEAEDSSKLNRIIDNNSNCLIILPDVHLHFVYFLENIEIAKTLQNVQMNEENSNILKQKFASNYF